MKANEFNRLSDLYLAALRLYLECGSRVDWEPIYEVGNQSLSSGMGTLDMAKIHDKALAALVSPDSADRGDLTCRATLFFAAVVRPIEEAHRGESDGQDELKRLHALLAQLTLDLANSTRELQREIAERKLAEDTLEKSERESTQLIEDSRDLQKHLQEMAHQTLAAQESERKTMSLKLQNEIAQALLGIHVRLLALKKEVLVSDASFKNEIATMQRLVQESVKTINRFVREYGTRHEN